MEKKLKGFSVEVKSAGGVLIVLEISNTIVDETT